MPSVLRGAYGYADSAGSMLPKTGGVNFGASKKSRIRAGFFEGGQYGRNRARKLLARKKPCNFRVSKGGGVCPDAAVATTILRPSACRYGDGILETCFLR